MGVEALPWMMWFYYKPFLKEKQVQSSGSQISPESAKFGLAKARLL